MLTLAGCTTNSAPVPPPAAAAPPATVAQPAAARGDVQAINDEFMAHFREAIAGHENEPAEKVFNNIQWLKTTPAERFLRIMNGGYSRALGVSCLHCHAETDFASDEKRPKRAAREMAVMHRSINEQLKKMENLASDADARAISCIVCHRGEVNPMASLK
jgi:hypothetical protein